MKNKSRFLTVCTLVLCAALLAFGVYALKNATLTASGTIGFKAHDCNILVYGKITGAVTSADDLSGESKELYLVDYSGDGEFTKDAAFSVTGTKDLTFANNLWKYDEESTTAQKQPIIYFDDSGDTAPNIVLTLYLKNNSAYPVSVDAQITQTPDGISVSKSDLTRLEKDADYSKLTITLTLDPDTDHIDTSDVNFGMSIYFAKAKAQLPAPGNVIVDADNKTVTFDAVDGATSYEIAYYKEGEDSGEPLYTQEVSLEEQAAGAVDLEYEPSQGGSYVVKVRAVREENGVKDYSNYASGDNSLTAVTPTSATLFTFEQNDDKETYAVTGYIGDTSVEEVIIPRSFSKDAEGNFIDGNDFQVDTLKKFGSIFNIYKFTGSVVLLDNIKEISSSAFQMCTALKSVTLPATLQTIGTGAFAPIGISDVYYGGTIEQWCNIDFMGKMSNPCESGVMLHVNKNEEVTSVNFADFKDYTQIKPYVLAGCEALSDITIPEKITKIGMAAFYNSNVSNVTILNGLTEIEESAFASCKLLTQITLPQSLTTIGVNAFASSGLENITLPKNVTSIAQDMFSSCAALSNVIIEGEVTEIGATAFQKCKALSNITLPKNLITIGRSAFASSGLGEITIPESVTTIEQSAFDSCKSLSNVVFKEGITEIKNSVFNACESLTQITLPQSLLTIGNKAFLGCLALTQITLPQNLTSIGQGAFKNSGLQEITIPAEVTVIASSTFSGCKALSKVVFEGEVTEIGGSAFAGCELLTHITLPNSLTTIGDYAFESSGLEAIIIPEKITSFMITIVDKCKSLSTITILGKSAIIKLIIPLQNCDKLSKVYYSGTEEEFYAYLKYFSTEVTIYYKISGPEAKDGAPEKWWYFDPADESGTRIIDSDTPTE